MKSICGCKQNFKKQRHRVIVLMSVSLLFSELMQSYELSICLEVSQCLGRDRKVLKQVHIILCIVHSFLRELNVSCHSQLFLMYPANLHGLATLLYENLQNKNFKNFCQSLPLCMRKFRPTNITRYTVQLYLVGLHYINYSSLHIVQ